MNLFVWQALLMVRANTNCIGVFSVGSLPHLVLTFTIFTQWATWTSQTVQFQLYTKGKWPVQLHCCLSLIFCLWLQDSCSTKPWSKEAGEHWSGLLEVRDCTLSVGISKSFMSCQKKINKKQTNKTHKHTQNKELT